MKVIKEHIVVKVPSVFFDETRYKGYNGRQIAMFVYQNPEQHVRNFGTVVSVPDVLPQTPLLSEYIGMPAYYDRPRFRIKRCSDIVMDIRVGDKAYFHHNALLPDMNMGASSAYNKMYLYAKKETENGKEILYHYFRVKYEMIYAVVRYEPVNSCTKDFEPWMEEKMSKFNSSVLDDDDHSPRKTADRYIYTDRFDFNHVYEKKVIPIGSWTFIQPDVETWEDISIPIAETVGGKVILNEDGTPRLKPKDQWLVTKSEPRDKYLRGWIKYVGNPLKGDEPVLEEGMYVYFRPLADTKMKLEGVDYFRMRQRHIACVEPARALA